MSRAGAERSVAVRLLIEGSLNLVGGSLLMLHWILNGAQHGHQMLPFWVMELTFLRKY